VNPQEHLTLIEAVIRRRLQGDAFETWTEAEQNFGGTSLKDLYLIRGQLLAEVAAGRGGPMFSLARPTGC